MNYERNIVKPRKMRNLKEIPNNDRSNYIDRKQKDNESSNNRRNISLIEINFADENLISPLRKIEEKRQLSLERSRSFKEKSNYSLQNSNKHYLANKTKDKIEFDISLSSKNFSNSILEPTEETLTNYCYSSSKLFQPHHNKLKDNGKSDERKILDDKFCKTNLLKNSQNAPNFVLQSTSEKKKRSRWSDSIKKNSISSIREDLNKSLEEFSEILSKQVEIQEDIQSIYTKNSEFRDKNSNKTEDKCDISIKLNRNNKQQCSNEEKENNPIQSNKPKYFEIAKKYRKSIEEDFCPKQKKIVKKPAFDFFQPSSKIHKNQNSQLSKHLYQTILDFSCAEDNNRNPQRNNNKFLSTFKEIENLIDKKENLVDTRSDLQSKANSFESSFKTKNFNNKYKNQNLIELSDSEETYYDCMKSSFDDNSTPKFSESKITYLSLNDNQSTESCFNIPLLKFGDLSTRSRLNFERPAYNTQSPAFRFDKGKKKEDNLKLDGNEIEDLVSNRLNSQLSKIENILEGIKIRKRNRQYIQN